jgi:hypothetical protein
VQLSTHYYVISLSERSNALFEAFRDTVIDIRNGGFPVEVSPQTLGAGDTPDREERLRDVLKTVDQYFGDCYRLDPLRLILVGEKNMLDLFTSVTSYRNVIVGRVEGDFSTTSLHDLGKIVWPVIREAVSGVFDDTLRDLEIAAGSQQTVCGLAAVSELAMAGVKATLVVEDDYHLRGSIQRTPQNLEISRDVDVMEEIDDAVDAVIEKILESGGNVVFMPNGALDKLDRIALLLRESREPL